MKIELKNAQIFVGDKFVEFTDDVGIHLLVSVENMDGSKFSSKTYRVEVFNIGDIKIYEI